VPRRKKDGWEIRTDSQLANPISEASKTITKTPPTCQPRAGTVQVA
jgi:hypothetical protein